MINIRLLDQVKNNFFSNDTQLCHNSCSLLDNPKVFINESLDFMNSLDNDLENSYHNIEIQNIIPIFKTKYEILEKINPLEKKSTAIFTNTNISKLFVSFEKIEKILKKLNDESFNKYITKIQKYKEDPELKKVEYEMNLLKKKRKNNREKDYIKNNNSKNARGRKKTEDQTKRPHNKKSADNIIKKIKGYFIEFLIIFVNAIINKDKNGFKSLDYKENINKIKKEEDLKLLRTTVKDYLYQDISSRYYKTTIDWNKNLINSILEEQKDNEAINFVLNMKIKDWIELFTLNKTTSDFKNLSFRGCIEIQSKIPSIKKLFDEIIDKNKDDFYFTKFVFYLYNYEMWFINKRGRNRKKDKFNEKIK